VGENYPRIKERHAKSTQKTSSPILLLPVRMENLNIDKTLGRKYICPFPNIGEQ
jgi:hypothetical protein